MHFNDVNVDQVFNEYAKIMEESGHMSKQATYSLPDFVAGSDDYTEVDTRGTLLRLAEEKLYDLSSEDVTSGAHPEGSTKVVDAPDGLGEVETLEAAQKKIQEVAEKKVTLAKLVVALLDDLDRDGFNDLRKDLDEKLAAFLGHGLAKKASTEQAKQLIEQLGELVAGTFTESNMLVDHYRDQLNGYLVELSMHPDTASLREFPKQYYKFLEHMWSRPEGKGVAQNMYQVYQDVVDLTNQAVNALNTEYKEPEPHTEEMGVSKEDEGFEVEFGQPQVWPESQKPIR